MPPANDNFASAIVLAAGGGSTAGSNVEAAAESGEPANSGKTVWYKWISTMPRAFVSTRFTAPTGKQLNALIRVFTGPDLFNLTEVSYAVKWNQYAAFAGAGTYYIRVDGMAGDEGQFVISWGEFFYTYRSSCTSCEGEPISAGEVCLTDMMWANVASIQHGLQSFGDIAAGRYRIRHCHGAFSKNPFYPGPSNEKVWTVSYDEFSSWIGWIFQLKYSPGGTIRFSRAGPRFYPTQAAAEAGFRCAFNSIFAHTGGDISLEFSNFTDFPSAGNGNPNPVWRLSRFFPKLLAAGGSAAYDLNPGINGQFLVRNLSELSWRFIATMMATGGVNNPSAPVLMLPINPGQLSQNISFRFDPQPNIDGVITATILFTALDTGGDGVLVDFILTPVLVGTGQTLGALNQCNIPGRTFRSMTFRITNNGSLATTNLVATVTAPGSLGIMPPPELNTQCAQATASRVFSLGKVNPNGGTSATVTANVVNGGTVLMVALTDSGGVTYPPLTINF